MGLHRTLVSDSLVGGRWSPTSSLVVRAGRRRDAAASRPRPPASGGGAGRRRRSSSGRRSPVSRIVPRDHPAAHGFCRRTSRHGSARRASHGLGAATDRGRDRPRACDRLADAQAGGDLPPAEAAARAAAPLRVALPGRSLHIDPAVRPLQRAGHASPATGIAAGPRNEPSATSGCTRPPTTTAPTPTASSTATRKPRR